jgi:glycosyltransferase involved in cell wall biosynthesis
MVKSDDPRVKILVLDKSIGQRAGYNLGVRESSGEFVMKIDAHALMSPGYDEALKAHCPPQTVVLPEMRRLDVHKWEFKNRGYTWFMFFGLDMYCHYWRPYRKRPEAQGDYPEVMTGQGSCWFTRRDWNDHIGLLDEGVGSWGNVGIEISLRTWLCGGSQIVNKQAWQAHWFRKDEGGFTYPMDGRQVAKAHKYTRENYYYNDNAFENQTRPFGWLIRKFAPVPGWEAYLVDEYKSPRVIIYYTDSQLEPRLASAVRKQLRKAAGPIPIISVSQEPLDFGVNINVGPKLKTYQSLYEQLLVGLTAAPEGSICYLCEHDVFYHPSHFAQIPKRDTHAYFNRNRYHYTLGAKSFLPARGKRALSQCVARREMLIDHCKERLALWEAGEPNRMKIRFFNFSSERPNVDIRHGDNLTPDGDYKRKYRRGIKQEGEACNLPGWGSPGHFGKKTGYKEVIAPGSQQDAALYLHRKWARRLPQPTPIRCPKFKRNGLAGIFRACGYTKGAEIGVRQGVFSEHLCKTIPGLELLCVDLWDAYYHFTGESGATHYEQAQERLAPYKATLVRATSTDAARDVEDGSLDFVYIDADHRFDYVMEDIITWARKVRVGGIISGHDYYRFRNAGVVPAVDVYTHCHYVGEWFITDEKEASFFWVKSGD